jgi:hypothetical protein
MLSASVVCKCLCAYCEKLSQLSASGCNRLWRDLCCSARKEDLARCADLMSYAE